MQVVPVLLVEVVVVEVVVVEVVVVEVVVVEVVVVDVDLVVDVEVEGLVVVEVDVLVEVLVVLGRGDPGVMVPGGMVCGGVPAVNPKDGDGWHETFNPWLKALSEGGLSGSEKPAGRVPTDS
jgi:hypothetical protein